ncbi:protein MEI2-like 2 isoform X4 [Musa acuminata AAA Group]|uniref:protein MEI2-like 2 isoform X4 n=1 Tax=Musa acuminata AAA Group TaxID=214697 RepID=UPI0031D501A4
MILNCCCIPPLYLSTSFCLAICTGNMDQSKEHSVSEGLLSVSSNKLVPRAGTNLWKGPSSSSAFYGSTDASLFSSSLPVIRHGKYSVHGVHSADNSSSQLKTHSQYLEGEFMVDELDFQEDEVLLPNNEEDLLAGIMDGFDLTNLPKLVDESEDCDLFGSVGGFELDSGPTESITASMENLSISDSYAENGIGLPNGFGTVSGEHPYGEHPSRTLFVRNINSNVEDSELRSLFAPYGDIRSLYTACKHRGFVMISYYDIRAAKNAMRALQNKPLRRRKLDIHFSIPKENPSDKDMNQGTLVIFNLDSSVSNDDLFQIFGVHGEIKEIRETPNKWHHKFIEFYDVRAAEAALQSLNKCELGGKRIKLEPSRPGGARRNLMQQTTYNLDPVEARVHQHHGNSPVNSFTGTWFQFNSPNECSPFQQALCKTPAGRIINSIGSDCLPGLSTILSPVMSNSTKVGLIKDQEKVNYADQLCSGSNSSHEGKFQHCGSPRDHNSGILASSPGPLSSLGPSASNVSGFGSLTGSQFLFGSPTSNMDQPQSSWRSPVTGLPFPSNDRQQRKNIFYSNQHDSFPGSSHGQHHLVTQNSGSGPTALWNPGIVLTGNIPDNNSPKLRMMQYQRSGPNFFGNNQYPGSGSFGLQGHSRQFDSQGSQDDNKKRYLLDLDKIVRGEDTRTTLMIKNIPNKYTSKMLLAAIDENHKGTYDFLYLPIDFKNKCNVGYAFINMVSPSHIISFYKTFNGKKWEKLNSEKVALLAYARIQGKAALCAHFENSSLMNEDKRCRPVILYSEGSDNIDQKLIPLNGVDLHVHQQDETNSVGDSTKSPVAGS